MRLREGLCIARHDEYKTLISPAYDEKRCRKYFNFLEEMARSNDKLISEVVESTVMEELHDYLSDDKFKPYLGNESKVSLSAVSGYMEKIDS